MLPIKFWFIWLSGFREDLKKQANQKQELPVVAMFVNGSKQNEQSLNLVGSIYGQFSIKIAHFIPIH
jgi:hypothetical protein